MISIRRLPRARWAAYRKLRLEALKSDSPAFGSSYGEEVKMPPDVWRQRITDVLFAVSGGVPIGMVSVVFSDRVKTRHLAFIYGLYVTPGHRGKGVGTTLIDAVIAKVRKNRNILKVELSVNPEFRAALSIYQKAGFLTTGRAAGELKVGRRFYDLLNLELRMK